MVHFKLLDKNSCLLPCTHSWLQADEFGCVKK